MRNVHERHIHASPEAVGEVLESLASDDDRLWAAPAWPPMVLDRGLEVGSSGGHDDVRYHVTAHEPGIRVEFTFAEGLGLVGTHAFEIDDRGDGTATLRHVLGGHAEGSMRLLWPLVVRWAHDACVEDALDRAERSLGVGPEQPATWSPYVRLLWQVRQRMLRAAVRDIETPAALVRAAALPRVDFHDTFAVRLPAGAPADVRVWHRVLADAGLPPWVHALLRVRNMLARAMRLDTADPTDEASPLQPLAYDGETLTFGVDDRHLDFRGVLRVETADTGAQLEFATVVQQHNAAGRAYFALVRPFHRRVVPAMLRRAVACVPPTGSRATVSA